MKTIRPIKGRLTQKELHRQLNYNPKTGVLTWRVNKPRVHPGMRAGTQHADGHRDVVIDGDTYQENRLVWFWVTGDDPPGLVDHKNRKRGDNRWGNLRVIPHGMNYVNSVKFGARRGITERGPGVYRVRLTIEGKRVDCGQYSTFDKAYRARRKLERKHYGEFSCSRK